MVKTIMGEDTEYVSTADIVITQYPFASTEEGHQRTKDRIKKHEGYRRLPYKLDYDTDKGEPIYEPFKTGGYGHKVNEGEHNPNITGEQFNYTKAYWEDVFEKDFNIALTGTRKLVDESKTHPIAFGILVEMAYQMGVDGTSKFKKTLEFVKNGEYEKAGDEMLDSKWARQTNTRATTLSDLMKSVQNKVH